ncbi:hypothetical protein SteCoe_925 [Stentor coeruleus]|uniref:Uncharacterized protein n=1 Tax=Stentor coeruleus TaxID=5963 RepID=A0A1R2D339_9CILI|nr:hypothetical protein SteCoe_925 [Stentor coeruleus]
MCIYNANCQASKNSCECKLLMKYEKATQDISISFYCENDEIFSKKFRRLMILQSRVLQSTYEMALKTLELLNNQPSEKDSQSNETKILSKINQFRNRNNTKIINPQFSLELEPTLSLTDNISNDLKIVMSFLPINDFQQKILNNPSFIVCIYSRKKPYRNLTSKLIDIEFSLILDKENSKLELTMLKFLYVNPKFRNKKLFLVIKERNNETFLPAVLTCVIKKTKQGFYKVAIRF